MRKTNLITVLIVLCAGILIGGCGLASLSGRSGEKAAGGKSVKLKKDYPIEGVALTDVKFDGGFWGERLEINREVTIPHIFKQCEQKGRIDNFAIAGGLKNGEPKGNFPFDDSDVYKSIEAASYSLITKPDPKLEKYIDEVIVKISAAQEEDGYLYTARTNKYKKVADWYGPTRWSRVDKSHELYNAGHLYEAAVVHYQATGKRTLLNVALKNADMLCDTFGSGKLQKWPGHQVVEMGLVKLYRVTRDEKYLNLAKFFLDVRGPKGGEYAQAHKKPVDQNEAVGHAVRAVYMYGGMTDIAALTGDTRYADAVEDLWENVTGRKMYLTGGLGTKSKDEAFGKDYELPNASYCETCAAIGSAMWNYRMFRMTGDGKYMDLFERVLYNGLISGISISGDKFFYVNPLESKGQHKREPWFSCACCPPNIARFTASLPGYVYAHTSDTIYVNMFATSDGTINLKDNIVRIRQETRYPWDGSVRINVEPKISEKFTVAVRIPGWAQGNAAAMDLYKYAGGNNQKIRIKLNGLVIEPQMKNGFALIERQWQAGDSLELNMSMEAKRVVANPNVAADVNKVAVERGPIVYCEELTDKDANISVSLPNDATLSSEHRSDLLNGITIVSFKTDNDKKNDMVPYYAWGNHGPSKMAVWLTKAESAITTQEQETISKLSIDVNKTSEPISKYIYGQFIEHLGRCIYGGMWAEMIEDRKFYYAITDEYKPWGTDSSPRVNAGQYKYLKGSPWKVIGPAGTVTMDTNDPYVGKWTPVIGMAGNTINLQDINSIVDICEPGMPKDGFGVVEGRVVRVGDPFPGPIVVEINLIGNNFERGISQDGLAIVEGKGYTGRIILAGGIGRASIVVRIVPDNGKAIDINLGEVSGGFKAYMIGFTAPVSSDNVRIEIVGNGKGEFRIGALSLMPADNIKGWRRDVVELLKGLDSPIYRWPGGNFVSGYNWRDGIGEKDKRPPRKNPAWKGVEHDDVGIHEFMELMEIIGSEPYIALNTGKGTIEEAAAEVEYCTGDANTPMGKLRAQNGHLEPYKVEWWAVGNEMYGNWQIGHIPLEQYVKKHNEAAEAIWKVDPNAKLVGVGNVGKWSETMLRVCANDMNLLSEHIYCKEIKNVTRHTKQLANEIKRVAGAHRKYRRDVNELAGKDIQIAMDEWNYWYGNYVYGELGTQYYLKDALGVATGLHEFFRNSDLYYMANYAQTVNVIGAIKTSPTESVLDTTGQVLKLYRRHFGQIPVGVSGTIGPMDVSAALTENREKLTVAVVNPTDKEREIPIELKGTRVADKGKQWIITGPDPMAINVPGKEPQVTIVEKSVLGLSGKLAVPGYSVNIFELEIQN